jgi:hypothetical protein
MTDPFDRMTPEERRALSLRILEMLGPESRRRFWIEVVADPRAT